MDTLIERKPGINRKRLYWVANSSPHSAIQRASSPIEVVSAYRFSLKQNSFKNAKVGIKLHKDNGECRK